MHNKINIGNLVVFSFLLLAACQPKPSALTVMTHDSFAISASTVAAFEQENDVEVEFLLSGDAGSMLNRAILSKNTPIADVIYGIDNTFLSRALDEDLFISYPSALLNELHPALLLDSGNHALPVDFGDVCINFDIAYFEDQGLALPASFEDLTAPQYEGLLVVENPATSSPGLSFLLATIAEFGEDGYLPYWERLKENGVVVVNDWETAYYSNFSGSSGNGEQPMVVSYGTSPAAEVIFSEQPLSEAPTASIVNENMCYRQVEFVGILKNTKNQQLAEKFVDFMLGVKFQEDIPLNMFVFPANASANIPQSFIDYVQIPASPAQLDASFIAENRDEWITDWRLTMLE